MHPLHAPAQVRALTIALAFHQMVEGFSLGTLVLEASFSMLKQVRAACVA